MRQECGEGRGGKREGGRAAGMEGCEDVGAVCAGCGEASGGSAGAGRMSGVVFVEEVEM